jgi:hypothetical protein
LPEAPADIRVVDAPDRSRFEIQVGGEVAQALHRLRRRRELRSRADMKVL